MRVVLPREADAAERLHAVLAVRERGVERERRAARRSRHASPLSDSPHGAGRVPDRGARELGAGEHVGAAVLDALELADRPAELHAHLRVLGRGLDAPLRDADRFGGEEHGRELADPLRRDRRDGASAPGAAVDLEPRALGGSGRRSASSVHGCGARSRSRTRSRSISATTTSASAPPRTGSRGPRAPRRRWPHRARAAATTRPPRARLASCNTAAASTVGNVRTGCTPPARAPRARPPARRSRSPRRRRPRRRGGRASPARAAPPRTRGSFSALGVERRTRHRRRDAGFDEAADGDPERFVFVGESDRHVACSHGRTAASDSRARRVRSGRRGRRATAIFSPSRTTEMAWVGQPCAASTTLSSGCAVGSTTTAMPSSSRSNTPGAQNEQFPEPMHSSRSIVISSAMDVPRSLPGQLAERARTARRWALPMPGRDRRRDRCAPSAIASAAFVSSPAAMRARNAAPSAPPSGTAATCTGRPVASASASTHPSTRVPPPVATMRRARNRCTPRSCGA